MGTPVIDDDGTIYIYGEYPGEVTGNGWRNCDILAISPSGTLKWFFSLPNYVPPPALAFLYNRSVTISN
jgi:hypothetical protein